MPKRPSEPAEFEQYGLIITGEPGWQEIPKRGDLDVEHRPLILAKRGGLGFLQFSVQPQDMKGGVSIGFLRQCMIDMKKETEMGPGFDLVQLKTKPAFILAASFHPGDIFHRLWYWTDRKRLVLVTYTCTGDPDLDELRESAAMVGRLRMNRRPLARRVKG